MYLFTVDAYIPRSSVIIVMYMDHVLWYIYRKRILFTCKVCMRYMCRNTDTESRTEEGLKLYHSLIEELLTLLLNILGKIRAFLLYLLVAVAHSSLVYP